MNFAEMRGINARINSLEYNHGIDPLWEPIDADGDGGSCSNYAVAKYRALRAIGFPREALILTCAFAEPFQIKDEASGLWRDALKGERYHAVLVVELDGKRYEMDNRKPYPSEIELSSYEYHKLWDWDSGKWMWAEGADRSFA